MVRNQPKLPGAVLVAGRARAPVVQRLLAYNAPILAADIQSVTELKQGSVYRLESANHDRLIIKVEMFGVNEGRPAYTARHAMTTELAGRLQGAPGTEPLTVADRGVLNGLAANTPGGGIASLQASLAAEQQMPNIAVFKAEHVDAGRGMGDLFTPRPGAWQAPEQTKAPYRAMFTQAAVQRELGRVALFDLLVGNADRFRPNRTINLDNLDFTQHGPASVDNVDPDVMGGGWQSGNPWEGEQWLISPAKMTEYATGAVNSLLQQTGTAAGAFQQQVLIGSFVSGMKDAARNYKSNRPALHARSIFEADDDRAAAQKTIVSRLDRITYR